MYRSAARLVLNLSLLASFVGVVVTGLVSDQLDLHQFVLHRRLGYVMAVFAIVHVGLHWRYFTGRRLTVRRRQAHAAVVTGSTAQGTDNDMAKGGGGQGVGDAIAEGCEGVPRRAALVSVGASIAGAVAGWSVRSELSPNPYRGGDVGEFYHQESSLGVKALVSNLLDWGRSPGRYKPDADGELAALPRVANSPAMSVAEALERRRSLRDYADRAITAEELAWVVKAATGLTSNAGHRSAPSAGALYPIETYVAISRVEGFEPGLYHVDVRAQALRKVRSGSVAGDLMVAGLGQGFLRSAPVVLILTGLFQRTRAKYHQRHYRYVCWEGGHIAQNVYLAAEAAGMGACMVGAFLDGSLNSLLRVDGRQEAALGLIAIGPR